MGDVQCIMANIRETIHVFEFRYLPNHNLKGSSKLSQFNIIITTCNEKWAR